MLLVGVGLTFVAVRFVPALSDWVQPDESGPWNQAESLPPPEIGGGQPIPDVEACLDDPSTDEASAPDIVTSYPITDSEARSLLDRLDSTSIALLNALVETDEDHEDLGLLIWENVQAITGARDWRQFSRRVGAPIHRELRAVTGDSRAILLLDDHHLGLDDDPTAPSVVIVGPAVSALRRQFEQV